MRNSYKHRLCSMAAVIAIAATTVFSQVPQVSAEPAAWQDYVHTVGSKNYWKGYRKKQWKHYKRWNYNYRPNYWIGPAIGFGAGVIIGSMLTAPRGYAAPAYRGGSSTDAYCHRKYRSYNSRTKTYTGYDGKQHRCRIP